MSCICRSSTTPWLRTLSKNGVISASLRGENLIQRRAGEWSASGGRRGFRTIGIVDDSGTRGVVGMKRTDWCRRRRDERLVNMRNTRVGLGENMNLKLNSEDMRRGRRIFWGESSLSNQRRWNSSSSSSSSFSQKVDDDPSSSNSSSSPYTSPPSPNSNNNSSKPSHFTSPSPSRGSDPNSNSPPNPLSNLTETLSALPPKLRARFWELIKQWQVREKFAEVAEKVSQATGYEEIDRLKRGVGEKEKSLQALRQKSRATKSSYDQAVTRRAQSHAEVNDLLQRKAGGGWGEGEVGRFTELVKKDHENEMEEKHSKEELEKVDEETDKAFSELMQAILERYHEEQVWSDKVRSLSSYGSIAITAANILLFILAVLIVEPWKRKKMVQGFEKGLEERESRASTKISESFEEVLSQILSAEEKIATLVDKLSIELDGPHGNERQTSRHHQSKTKTTTSTARDEDRPRETSGVEAGLTGFKPDEEEVDSTTRPGTLTTLVDDDGPIGLIVKEAEKDTSDAAATGSESPLDEEGGFGTTPTREEGEDMTVNLTPEEQEEREELRRKIILGVGAAVGMALIGLGEWILG